VENLLDIDFDGAVPASLQGQQPSGSSGLEDLMGDSTPAPVAGTPATQPNTMDDLMGLFGGDPSPAPAQSSGVDDLMNGFGGLDMSGSSQPAQKKTNEDILSLF